MSYTNSPLATYTNVLNHHYPNRSKIDTITIHCVAGVNCSLQAVWNTLNNYKCSSNYCIDSNGAVGLFVPEQYGSWCSSNYANDMRAITIEVVNSGGTPNWPVTDAALKSVINLCADICKRNGIASLKWSDKKADRVNHTNGCNMTVHRDYAAKACPGDYLMSKMPYIADAVNKILGGAPPVTQEMSIGNQILRVQVGAFSTRTRAANLLKELQTKGYEGIVVLDQGLYKVQLGAFRVRSNAENLYDSVHAAGYDAFITTRSGTMVATYGKSINDLALEVIAGKWGSGADRTKALTAAGYDAQAVQKRVNELL